MDGTERVSKGFGTGFWDSEDSSEDRIDEAVRGRFGQSFSAPIRDRGFELKLKLPHSSLLLKALLSPKRVVPQGKSRRLSMLVTPRKANSPRSPRLTLKDVDAIEKMIPGFLEVKAFPWQVTRLLEKLRKLVEEQDEENASELISVADALGRELCLLKRGGYVAITLSDLKEPLTLVAPAMQLCPQAITWQVKELKAFSRNWKIKLKKGQVKSGEWVTVSCLGQDYFLEGDQMQALFGYFGLKEGAGQISLVPAKRAGQFRLRCGKEETLKPFIFHCDLPFRVKAWWEEIVGEHRDPSSPREFDDIPLIDELRRRIKELDGRVEESLVLTQEVFEREWPVICEQVLRLWDLFDQLEKQGNLWTGGLLDMRLKEKVVVSHRLPDKLDRAKMPHPLWLMEKGRWGLREVLNACDGSVKIIWSDGQFLEKVTRYLPPEELVEFLGKGCSKELKRDLLDGKVKEIEWPPPPPSD